MLSSDFIQPWLDPPNGRTFLAKEKRENEVNSKHLLGSSENSATAVSQLV